MSLGSLIISTVPKKRPTPKDKARNTRAVVEAKKRAKKAKKEHGKKRVRSMARNRLGIKSAKTRPIRMRSPPAVSNLSKTEIKNVTRFLKAHNMLYAGNNWHTVLGSNVFNDDLARRGLLPTPDQISRYINSGMLEKLNLQRSNELFPSPDSLQYSSNSDNRY